MIRRYLYRLTRRERTVLATGAAILAALLFWGLLIDPMAASIRRMDREIPKKEKELKELTDLRAQYLKGAEELRVMEARLGAAEFSPLSFIEETAARHQIKQNIAYIRPLSPQRKEPYREDPIEVKAENVTLERLVGLLADLEKGNLLKVRRLALRTRFADPSFLDATFSVSTFARAASP